MCKLFTGFQAKVFESCYWHNPCTVGIVGPSAEFTSSLQSRESCSITLIDYKSRAVPKNSSDDPASRHKLQNFVVSIPTVTKLKKVLQDLKTSQWWNHMASFLIIDRPALLNRGCSTAFQVLSTAWEMNLLRSKFICHHESKGLLIYSYNPYTNQAPIPWQVEKTYRIKKTHPWTLLVRSYQDSQEICKNLDFDQTKNLGGYEIRASIYPSYINKSSSGTKLESLIGINGIITHYMFDALNSTIAIFPDASTKKLFNTTISGVTDIASNVWYQQNDSNSSMTYPFFRSGLAAITQRRGYLSQIGKFLRVIDHSSEYAVVVVVFLTFVFFKFFLRQSVMSTILSIVRLICNSSVPNIPNNLAARIYLTGLFLFVVTIQAIYQGQLASLLTKPVALPNVETFEDLENFEYTIYCHASLTSYFEKLNFRGRVVGLNNFDCEEHVLKNHAAACVHDKNELVSKADKFGLYLSEPLIPMYVTFLIREDWPVEERFNILMSRLVEGNLLDDIFKKDFKLILRKNKFDKKHKDDKRFAVITLKELAFAFALLGIGLAGATVVFFVEVWKARSSLNMARNRVWAMACKVKFHW